MINRFPKKKANTMFTVITTLLSNNVYDLPLESRADQEFPCNEKGKTNEI